MKSHEWFVTFQGTGALQGVLQFFIRLPGCSVRCPIRKHCDEGPWLDDREYPEIDCEQLAEQALLSVGKNGWIHITGGEPCQHPQLKDIALECTRRGLRIHLQTSGTIRIPIEWDWLTVSPKCLPSQLVQTRGDEMVLLNASTIVAGSTIAEAFYRQTRFLHYYLQPFDDNGIVNNQQTSELCSQLNRGGMSWRLAIQAHKYWGIK